MIDASTPRVDWSGSRLAAPLWRKSYGQARVSTGHMHEANPWWL